VTAAFTECVLLGLQLDTWNLLADCTDLVWTPTIADLKELVDALALLGVTERFREALVQPIDVTAAVSVGFWETAGVNRGLAMRTFRDRSDAVAWLESPVPPDRDPLVLAAE
jgi:hypothetical protein